MPSIAVGTLVIKDDNFLKKIAGSIILLSVNLKDEKISKYYTNVARYPHTEVNDAEESSEESDNDSGNRHEENDNVEDEDSDKEGQQVVEISKMLLENLRTTIKPQDATIVSVSLKSLKKLELVLRIRSERRKIALTFP